MNEHEVLEEQIYPAPENISERPAVPAFLFLLIGLGVGAAAALLLAPMTGAELRDKVRRRYGNAMDRIGERTAEIRESGANLINFYRSGENPKSEEGEDREGEDNLERGYRRI